ncbi:MAG: choice-of-anchor tandem repeat GloVer-containing protein [Rhizomicrobium sp.]|jgi:uncharacterized repeat protein (TIGR03803 family)
MLQIGGAEARSKVLYKFNGGSDGAYPAGTLVMDKSGNLYGTTSGGGGSLACGSENGCGTVFKIAPDGSESVLHAFQGGADQGVPMAGLAMDREGNLYGTTFGGTGIGYGTVFKIAPDGTETIMHSFGPGADGQNPSAPMIMDKRGNFYGTTTAGGDYGKGTIFEIAKNGREYVLWSFGAAGDGAVPSGGLFADKAGNFYGTTRDGGSETIYCGLGCGTVFEFTPNVKESVLWSFGSTESDGENPVGGVVADASGNLYGVAAGGGAAGSGAVFSLAADGTEILLHSFGQKSGIQPMAGVILGRDGNLYGTNSFGGTGIGGTVYSLSPDGTNFRVVHNFIEADDGHWPYAGVLAAGDILYGTTFEGGNTCPYTNQCGVVFALRR